MSKRNIEEGESSKPKRNRSSRCNYCFRERELVYFKPYCTKCAEGKSVMHDVLTVKAKKTGLSPYDDKRYVLDDHITTLAFGHYKTDVGK